MIDFLNRSAFLSSHIDSSLGDDNVVTWTIREYVRLPSDTGSNSITRWLISGIEPRVSSLTVRRSACHA